MAVPTLQDFFLPFLSALADGEEHSNNEVRQRLIDHFELTEDEANELNPSGEQTRLATRMGWARTHLKNAGLVRYVRPGAYQITDRGRRVMEEAPEVIDMKFLNQFDEHREWQQNGGKGEEVDSAGGEEKESRSIDRRLTEVAYFLARRGLEGPPDELEAETWNDAFMKFYPALGGSLPRQRFYNRLKNLRDRFDGYFPNNRQGWKREDGTPQSLSRLASKVYEDFADVSDDELWQRVRKLILPKSTAAEGDQPSETAAIGIPIESKQWPAYPKSEALRDLFLEESTFDRLLALMDHKKNLILQGPPGVGKTFIAKRLAYALVSEKDPESVLLIQFHQSYSYEDFIQGYRPDGTGGFQKVDGVFYRFCKQAHANPGRPHVFIIDEINRGNLSRIFGELMLLIEGDKREENFAVPLTYSPAEHFFVPNNLYLLGLMNTADRSLAMVDYALRRRFAFADLRPELNSPQFEEALSAKGVPERITARIRQRIGRLNQLISEDSRDLGPGYQIGHSFFCPSRPIVDPELWYRQVVEFEIRPLLEEYWADSGSRRASEEIGKLLDE